MEYKSPTDYFSIDDYYKVKAYVYLYKALAEGRDSIHIKLLQYLPPPKHIERILDYIAK